MIDSVDFLQLKYLRYPLVWRVMLPHRGLVGDAIRFVVLHRLGGVYVDVDTLLLRDMQPLLDHEFAYRWSSTNRFNTAVLRLFANSNVSSILINEAEQSRSPYAFYPTSIHQSGLPSSFYRLPCVLFDPIWLAIDNADSTARAAWQLDLKTSKRLADPFVEDSRISTLGRSAFEGAFAYHWHSTSVPGMYEHGSYLDQWNAFYDE